MSTLVLSRQSLCQVSTDFVYWTKKFWVKNILDKNIGLKNDIIVVSNTMQDKALINIHYYYLFSSEILAVAKRGATAPGASLGGGAK